MVSTRHYIDLFVLIIFYCESPPFRHQYVQHDLKSREKDNSLTILSRNANKIFAVGFEKQRTEKRQTRKNLQTL